mgnify:CR=1 FL=1
MKYILVKDETIRRTERMQYEVEIPRNIKNKIEYADNQIKDNNYRSYKMIDIVDSELLDDEVVNLKIKP